MTIKAIAVISGSSGASGILHFTQENPEGVTVVQGKISGLKPGLHGLNIHALGDTSNGCASTGSHFNPHGKPHGGPDTEERHAGDLGNIEAGADGCAEVSIVVSEIPLSGPYSIIGRAVVVHADPDDLGKGCNESSKTTGNSGTRVACGVIGLKAAPAS